VSSPAAASKYASSPPAASDRASSPPAASDHASSPPAASDRASSPPAAFYFDLASPLAYLAAERVLHVLHAPAEWQPVLARDLSGGNTGRKHGGEHTLGRLGDEGAGAFHARIAARVRELGLQPLRWPDPFPFDSALAMRVATYAKSIGRTVPFAQAAFRQAFAGGRSLDDPDNVLIAAAACEMHPAAVLRGAELRSVAEQLAASTAAAVAAGVTDVPAVLVGGRVFVGDRCLEDAAEHMRATQVASAGTAGASAGKTRASNGTARTPNGTARTPAGTARTPNGTARTPAGTARTPAGTARTPAGTARASNGSTGAQAR
jgi:2-hydroxychromene-2-carboxylate isomerase